MSRYNYKRRQTTVVTVGNVKIGGDNPIRLQSMTNTSTLDTEASVEQIKRIAAAGADIVRLTAQGVNHARNLGVIRQHLRDEGINTPLVADIHFNPAAAFAAAEEVEKVRINPGNFVDPGRTFKQLSFTDEEYAAEIERIRSKFIPFLQLCRERGVAIRLGVNHGSLSDRIMSRYGDTPEGMVESAMEYLRICVSENFTNVVISIKASNVTIMTATVRKLVKAMDDEGMHFPLHLGVTEAGDAEDGRVKSAVGIGSLLADGIGDTIRVSLSEDPAAEIPVAKMLTEHIKKIANAPAIDFDCSDPKIKHSDKAPLAVGVDFAANEVPDNYIIVTPHHDNAIGDLRRQLDTLANNGNTAPVIIRMSYPSEMSADEITVAASVDLGAILLEGYADGIWLDAPSLSAEAIKSLSLSILQATRRRISKTEYIACPSCGRTLFNLTEVLHEIKQATSHLRGLKIGVMGCIVNGPGEMADADYGYVGAAAGNVSLYKGKQCVLKNIPAEEALPQLINLIKENGDWIDENSNTPC